MTNPKVSVLMTTYGHEQYIEEAIEGVLMQKADFPVELIIANDCSPDGTDLVVKRIIEDHPNGHWIKNVVRPKNLGMVANSRLAFEDAEGEYLAICEGDDYWTDPLKLQKQVDFLDKNQDFVACGASEDNLRFGKLLVTEPPYYEATFTQMDIGRGLGFPTLTAVFRNVDLKPLMQYEPIVGDIELYLYLSQFGKFKRMPFIGGVYRFHGKGAVSGNDDYINKRNFIRAKLKFNKVFKLFPKSIFKAELKRHIKDQIIRIPKDIIKRRGGLRKSVSFIIFCIKQYRTL